VPFRNRHECKYLVDEAVAARVVHAVQPYVRLDPHAARLGERSYPITSLYLDDAHRSLYRETVEGLLRRFKLRVRSYGDDPRTPLFLEIKRRHDRVVQKARCPLPRTLLPDVLAGRTVPVANGGDPQALAEFQRLMLLRGARPCALVRYQREAWIGREDAEIRVTVDRRLSVLPTHDAAVRMLDPGYVPVPMRGVVLELKFTDRCPPWMAAAIQAAELHRVSFSKYCNAVDAMRPRSAMAN
jgi:hypothetical protein